MATDSQQPVVTTQSQKQSTSGEADRKRKLPEDETEIQFFDTTISKLVRVRGDDGEFLTDEDGGEVWEEVMSDNLAPGEKLKRDADDEKSEEKADKLREAHAKQQSNGK